LAHSPSTPTSEPLLWTVSGLTALCKPRSRFESDANFRYSFPCLSWFAVQDHLGEGHIAGQKVAQSGSFLGMVQ
jgi:hypothetical protein